MNYLGLDEAIIDYVCEIAGSLKIGKCMPGTLIPVVEESRLFSDQPDCAIVFSWHIADELAPKLQGERLSRHAGHAAARSARLVNAGSGVCLGKRGSHERNLPSRRRRNIGMGRRCPGAGAGLSDGAGAHRQRVSGGHHRRHLRPRGRRQDRPDPRAAVRGREPARRGIEPRGGRGRARRRRTATRCSSAPPPTSSTRR